MDKTKLIVNKVNQKRWILMWVLVFLGYILFLINWMIMDGLAGNVEHTIYQDGLPKTINETGWLGHFFKGESRPSSITIQASNYSTTFIRGIGALIVAWLMIKITHKWTTIISIASLLAAIPAIWSSSYTGFIIFRMLLAFGGSMLVILLQPIKSVLETKIKKKLTTLATYGFSLGAILSLIPFVWTPEISLWFTNQWRWFSTIISLLTLLLLLAYTIVGQNFLPKPKEKTLALINLETGKLIKPRWRVVDLMKEWKTYLWIILFGTLLVLVVMPVILTRHLFGATSDSFEDLRYIKIWVIVALLGVIIGPHTIGLWLKTSFRRKPFIIFIIFISLLVLSGSFLMFQLQIIPLFLILGFIFGWLIQSIQGVVLYLAHECEENLACPKRLSSFYGIIWGCGYWVFTLFNILISWVYDNAGNDSKYWILLIFIIAGLLCIIATFFIKETKPHGRIFTFKKAPKPNKNFLNSTHF